MYFHAIPILFSQFFAAYNFHRLDSIVSSYSISQYLVNHYRGIDKTDRPPTIIEKSLAKQLIGELLTAINKLTSSPPAIIDNYQPGNEIETEMTLDVDDLLDLSSSDSEDESFAQADPEFTPETESKKTKSDDIPDFEYKERAVDFWKDTEGKPDKNGEIRGRRKFSSVSSRFIRCRSESTLRDWDKEVLIGGDKTGKLEQVSKYVLDRFYKARNSNFAVSNPDLAQWAHEHYQTLSVHNFQVHDTWVDRFKKRNKLASRMI